MKKKDKPLLVIGILLDIYIILAWIISYGFHGVSDVLFLLFLLCLTSGLYYLAHLETK